MQFSYRFADRQGRIEIGQAEAESREQLLIKLKSEGKFPLEIKEESATLRAFQWSFTKRMSAQDRLNFTRQLGNLLASGVPLEKALAIMGRLSLGAETTATILQLRRSLQEGLSFTAALEKFPHYFPEIYINMVRAGEAGGLLPQVLKRLGEYIHEEISLRRFIVSSLFYPLIVLVASIAAIFFYVGVVIPKFQSIFKDMGSELPLVTKVVMVVGNGLWQYSWVLVLLAIAGGIWFIREQSNPEGRLRIDRMKLKIPLIGPVLLRVATARMTMALGLLSGSGIPILEGLHITAKIVDNAVLGNALLGVEEQVKQGGTLANSMTAAKVFPTLAIEMIGVGEESGAIVEMLDQVAQTYDGEVKHSLSMFLAIFEPMLILIMVGVIAILAVAILLPILNMNSAINTMG